MLIICPHCHKEINTNETTYYARHKEEIIAKYKEKCKDPEFIAQRRAIALKSYHKRKQQWKNQ